MSREHRSRKIIGSFVITAILTGSLVICLNFLHPVTPSPHIISPLSASAEGRNVSPTIVPANNLGPSVALANAIQQALVGTYGTYGIVVKNLQTGESYETQEHTQFESASLYKLWVMATVYDEIQDKTLHLDEVLSENASVLNGKFNIASDSAEQTTGTVTYSVKDALEKMITISDNDAALLLTEKVGLRNIANFLTKNGFVESHLGTSTSEPTTTASDIALFFEKLYNGKLANKDSTEQMIALLKRQRLNEKIPKYLPNNIDIAHKTGELDDVTHDAGIIYGPSGPYILVVMTESTSPPQAIERIAQVSQSVYAYFTGRAK